MLHFSVKKENFEFSKQIVFYENFYDTKDRILLRNNMLFSERIYDTTETKNFKLRKFTKVIDDFIFHTDITVTEQIIYELRNIGVEVIDDDLSYSLPYGIFGFVTTRYYLENDNYYDFSNWSVEGKSGYYIVARLIDIKEIMQPCLTTDLACLYYSQPKEFEIMPIHKEIPERVIFENIPTENDTRRNFVYFK